jgi:putative selenate reductase
MRVLPFDVLLQWILKEFAGRQSIFGIHKSLFYVPRPHQPFASTGVFGRYLATPIGPAAGPHTQLAQNIIAAWLCGGRFFELKTVQIQDELEIPRPCIDMEDEGYNVEWSQELQLDQSALEYIKAWVLIHILHRMLDFESRNPLGTVFNISVGYNLAGIQSERLGRFLDRMRDASADLAQIRAVLSSRFPQFAGIEIPPQIADNVTLSTMHGCPAEEIEQIAHYLMGERGLHTTVKLNPTLLGKKRVLHILHDRLGFREIEIPGAVFDRDLRFAKAVDLIRTLQRAALKCNVTFGVKLGNTLPSLNHKKILSGAEMYMSGRALYPLTMNLFHELAAEFDGNLNVSFSGGADAFNVSTILSCGALPVTAATDLLKPGGYARFGQYLENLELELNRRNAADLKELQQNKRSYLEQAAAEALSNRRYQRDYWAHGLPKVDSGLELFDCISAPCVEPCAVHQDVPEYAWFLARGEFDAALAAIMSRNPLPGATGYVCTQLCRQRCTRSASNYDQPIAIRALKRFAVEKGRITLPSGRNLSHKVAIVGGGPAGLSAAYFLALNGIHATIFEARDVLGGMMRLAPAFRLPTEIIQADVDRIVQLGVDIRISHPISRRPEELLRDGFDAVYISSGFQKDAPLYIEGMQGPGLMAALDFLRRVRRGEHVDMGPKVLVIGGGNTAMDAARSAQRITGHAVTVVYRRTKAEMPAGDEDRDDALEEGVRLEELAAPIRVIRNAGQVVALECIRNQPGEPEVDGRRRPIPVEGSEFQIQADSIIVAIGQSPDIAFLNESAVQLRKDGSIAADPATGQAHQAPIYAGGDAVRGPDSIIAACADGRRAAEAICAGLGIVFESLPLRRTPLSCEEKQEIRQARARRSESHVPERRAPGQRGGFGLVESTLDEAAARSEARRCLQCSLMCDKCVEVCPNRANQTYQVAPEQLIVPVLSCWQDKLVLSGESTLHIKQSSQIVHLHDLCNECGNCATFCVHQGKPFRDKPRLFARIRDFDREIDNAFYIERSKVGWTVWRREKGGESKLELRNDVGEIVFENNQLKVTYSSADFGILTMELKEHFPGDLALVAPAEMYVFAKGITASLAFLP